MFKIGMFNEDNIEKHAEEFISYDGHLPYLIMAVLSYDDSKKRRKYLKSIDESLYNKEMELLKDERREYRAETEDALYNNDEKLLKYTKCLEALKSFLIENPNFQDILPKQHLKELLEN